MTDRLSDEQIIELICCHSNHKETSRTGIEYEVISHARAIEFARAIEEPLLLRIQILQIQENAPLKDCGERFYLDYEEMK